MSRLPAGWPGSPRAYRWSMIRKSGYRFSEKIMLKQKLERDVHRALGVDRIALQAVLPHEFAFSRIMFDRNRDVRDDLAIIRKMLDHARAQPPLERVICRPMREQQIPRRCEGRKLLERSDKLIWLCFKHA